jgi:hypothetical protein
MTQYIEAALEHELEREEIIKQAIRANLERRSKSRK